MSRRRGVRHLRHRSPGRGSELGTAVCYAACGTPGDLDVAKRQAHDKLLKLAAGHRRSGIRWEVFAGRDARDVFASTGNDPERYRDYLDFLDENPDGLLVVALARVTKMQPVTPRRRPGRDDPRA